jgi:hypothetical protein
MTIFGGVLKKNIQTVLRFACDFFDVFLFSTYPTAVVQAPLSRHPERSASRINYVTQRFVARSRRTSRVPILPTPFRPFQQPKPTTDGPEG